MKNLIFKAQVLALFEKEAFGHDPRAVLANLPKEDSGDLRRGLALMEGARGAASSAKGALGAGYRSVSKFVSPTHDPNSSLAKSISNAGSAIAKRPALARAAVGTAALAPILLHAFNTSQKQHEDELMNAYADPSRVIVASLDSFLEKKAELYSMTKEAAKAPKSEMQQLEARIKKFQQQSKAQHGKDVKSIGNAAARAVGKRMSTKEPGFWPSMGSSVTEGISKGIGSSVGGALVGLAAHGIGSGVDALRDHFMLEPKRKALVDTLLRTDPVLSDAVSRHPDSRTLVKDSYGTMVRFAPTLSLDINAVRSFLREAVMGGSGVNYATIKNLVDTERAIADAKPHYGQGH